MFDLWLLRKSALQNACYFTHSTEVGRSWLFQLATQLTALSLASNSRVLYDVYFCSVGQCTSGLKSGVLLIDTVIGLVTRIAFVGSMTQSSVVGRGQWSMWDDHDCRVTHVHGFTRIFKHEIKFNDLHPSTRAITHYGNSWLDETVYLERRTQSVDMPKT